MACHLFPGITPMNVWDIPWLYWRTGFAPFIDEHLEALREAAKRNV